MIAAGHAVDPKSAWLDKASAFPQHPLEGGGGTLSMAAPTCTFFAIHCLACLNCNDIRRSEDVSELGVALNWLRLQGDVVSHLSS